MEALPVIAELVKNVGDGPFKIIVLIVLYYGVQQLSKMRDSMERLNKALAVVIERTANHEKRISNLEKKKLTRR